MTVLAERPQDAPGPLRATRSFYAVLGVAVVAGFALRLLRLNVDVFNDEAWYFHLARHLARSGAQITPAHSEIAHFILRPFSALFFWPWAQLGLTAVRVVNITLGVVVVVQVAYLALQLRCHPTLAALSALLVALHYANCHVSAWCFPDTLATALMLLGVRYYLDGRCLATFAAFTLCLLTKEMFAPIPLALFTLCIQRSTGRWTVSRLGWALLASLLPVVLATLTAMLGYSAGVQGWSDQSAEWRFWVSLLLPPLMLSWPLLVRARRYTELALSLAFPVFFFLWSYVVGRGVSYWYAAAATPLSAIAFAAAGDTLLELRYRWSVGAQRFATAAIVVVGVAFVVMSLRLALRWGSESVLSYLGQPREVESIAALVAAHAPKNLILVDCFWAFAYYPFSATAGKVTPLTHVERAADLSSADLVVACEPSAVLAAKLAPCLLAHTDDYAVYQKPALCVAP